MMSPLSPKSNRHADILVIGAGVLGTFHSYFAAQKGYKTLLVERNTYPFDASTRNFGMIVRSIVETGGEWSTYVRTSQEIYQSIQQQHDIGVQVKGSLYIASTDIERIVLQEFVQAFSPAYNCTFLDIGEALHRYPFIQTSYCRGALLFPDDLTLEPRRMLRQLIPYIVQTAPIEYIPNTNIVAVESSGSQGLARDANGNIYTADCIFICCGAEYRTLFPEFFLRSGLKICKLQMMQTVPQPQILPHSILSGLSIERYPAFKSCPSYPLLQEQPIDQRIREFGIHLLFKQASDGSIIIGDSHEYSSFEDANLGEESTNCLINETVLSYGQQMITLPTWDIQKLWNGYYLIHPGHQVYTETIEDRIHIITGIAGKGMSTGPGFSRQHIEAVLG
jgi:FAD dependent oxidoreductase TIGR03364